MSNMEEKEKRATHPVESSKVKQGDIMAFVYYARVESSVPYSPQLQLTDLDSGKHFQVIGEELIVKSFSADQFAESQKVSRTQMAEILISSFNRPLTVWFTKQNGEERKLRGRLVQAETLLGRSYVEDLDLPSTEKHRLRLVDHRTIFSMVVDGVEYKLKS